MKHSWRVIGGAAGWDVCECRRCGYVAIPSPFGFMWPDLLRRFSAKYACVRPTGVTPVGQATSDMVPPPGGFNTPPTATNTPKGTPVRIDLTDLPDGYTVVDVIVLAKCTTADGDVRYREHFGTSLPKMERLGMCESAADTVRGTIRIVAHGTAAGTAEVVQ